MRANCRMISGVQSATAPAHFTAALQKASEYVNLDDKSFVEISAMVRNTKSVIPQSDAPSRKQASVDAERAQSVFGSVPLTSGSEQFDRRDSIRSSLPKPKLASMLNRNS